MTVQEKLYVLFEEPGKSRASFMLNTFIYILIIVSIINLMFYSIDPIREKYGYVLNLIRNIVMPIFIIEYLLRLYAAGSLAKYKGIAGKFSYATTPYAIIDLLSILPYLLINTGFNSSFIRSLRLLRIFRLFRVKKYAIFIQLMQKIFSNMKEVFIVLLFYTVVIIIILSFIIFEVEHEAQPEVFTNVFQTMWWSVATLTTVGYGDMFPITAAGKIVTTIITILGIGFIAIPGGIFASEFIAAIDEEKKKKENEFKCLKCGSSAVKISQNPSLIFSDKTVKFNTAHICEKCQFTWVEP
jgi:voltage-gated potassium channel